MHRNSPKQSQQLIVYQETPNNYWSLLFEASYLLTII